MEHFPQYKLSDFNDMGQVEFELLLARVKQYPFDNLSLAIEMRKIQALQIQTTNNKLDKDYFDDLFGTYKLPARLLTKEEYLAQRRAESRAKMNKEQFYKMNKNINREEQEDTKPKKTRKKKAV
jgi:hypothetical protein